MRESEAERIERGLRVAEAELVRHERELAKLCETLARKEAMVRGMRTAIANMRAKQAA